MKKIILIILMTICTLKAFAQGDGSGGLTASRVAHPRPARNTGGAGAAIASRAGYTAGVSTASIIAGTAAVVLITIAALIIADSNAH